MGFRIVIAGITVCDMFNQACLLADHLAQVLPDFKYERMEISMLEWDVWLKQMNHKHKWHHLDSPLVWKELLMKGSKPYYIGYGHDFMEYAHSYYKLDAFIYRDKLETLSENYNQFLESKRRSEDSRKQLCLKPPPIGDQRNYYDVCITGARFPLAMHLICELLEMARGDKTISKVFIHDEGCSKKFMEYIENECSFIGSNYPNKLIKYVTKLGLALTHSDVYIIMDHVPFDEELPIGTWLQNNAKLMENLAGIINATAPSHLKILFANVGPACYNATVLSSKLNNIKPGNIAVATSDLGLQIMPIMSQIAEVPVKNMFCPPVWGFVGVNHLIDPLNTIHVYHSFDPYKRYVKVKNSTLKIGSLTSEIRSMDYLLHYDDTLWTRAVERNSLKIKNETCNFSLSKSEALINIIKLWLFEPECDYIANVGILCDGSFGLNFKGFFSQPARLVNREWVPAAEFPLPNDLQMKLPYLVSMAELAMTLQVDDLPKIHIHIPCYCKERTYPKKAAKLCTIPGYPYVPPKKYSISKILRTIDAMKDEFNADMEQKYKDNDDTIGSVDDDDDMKQIDSD